MSLDPVTFEVLKHRLWQINDEQGTTIRTISTSPIVVEGNDFNVGLFTAEGDLVVAGPYVLPHVGTMDVVIKNVIRLADSIEDGDMFLVNDPYLGALHQNDVAVVSPLFHGGRPVLWVGNVLHHADVGGMDEGSFCVNARNVFQEPPRYFLKLVSRGRMSREVERTFTMNSRLPDAVALDLRAQVGAVNVALRRLQELMEQQGVETVLAVMAQSLDFAEQRLRRRFAELPEGRWSTEVFMDTDRVGSERVVRLRLSLEKRGDELLFDYTGSDPQTEGPVNATYPACWAGTTTPVYTFLCGGEIDWNAALRRCMRVVAPEGCVVNARFPAAVSICSIGFTWLAAVAAMRVVGQMCAASESHRDRACAPWSVAANCVNLFGAGRGGKTVGALLSDHRGIGGGGRSFGDGFDHAGQVFSYLSFMSNVESQEWKLPVLYAFRRQLADSGGPGRFRGGATVLTAVAPYGAERLVLKVQNTAGSDETNATGLEGGLPGAGSQVSVVRGAGLWERLRDGGAPLGYGDLGGTTEHLPSKADGHLGADDVLVFYPAGGGGFGDPLERDPERVRQDVRRGLVSPEWARRAYGVVLAGGGESGGHGGGPGGSGESGGHGGSGESGGHGGGGESGGHGGGGESGGRGGDHGGGPWVDEAATAAERARRRTERLGGREPAPALALWTRAQPDGSAATAPAAVTVHAGPGGEAVHCGRCGGALGPAGEGADGLPRDARVSTAALAEAGPWLALRWGGRSRRFELLQAVCPHCGALLDVRERLAGGDQPAGSAGGRGAAVPSQPSGSAAH